MKNRFAECLKACSEPGTSVPTFDEKVYYFFTFTSTSKKAFPQLRQFTLPHFNFGKALAKVQ